MEQTQTQSQPQKLGAGIIILSIIHFILVAFGILGTVILLTQKDTFVKQGIAIPLSDSQIIISIVLEVLLTIAVILILLKKSIGVYSYFTINVISIINTIIDSGFQWTILLSLIFPVLMAICIYRKKALFNF
ncbi:MULTISPECIES: hypothetical protein [unclassified Clostridium]|uniref:hypothetical protein n=1 Tax=unclassified Clostridium TaxID=2614128 RepID=UPI0002981FE7|nr:MULTISPECIES: hypothetical protein [unclassified Clostridium]EKQ57359.1 MAG: hypothetical protein A370_01010 [Clostridium sp. Maddingley MBC34-26]